MADRHRHRSGRSGRSDADAGLERALAIAYRYLNARERTQAEMRTHLQGKGIDPRDVERSIEALVEQGHLDDLGSLGCSSRTSASSTSGAPTGSGAPCSLAASIVTSSRGRSPSTSRMTAARSTARSRCCAGAFPRRQGIAGSVSARSACCCARATTATSRSRRSPPTCATQTTATTPPESAVTNSGRPSRADSAPAATGARQPSAMRHCARPPAGTTILSANEGPAGHKEHQQISYILDSGLSVDGKYHRATWSIQNKTQNPPGSRLLKAGTTRHAGIRSCSPARADRSLRKSKL